MIAVVDYGAGNLMSVVKALETLGYESITTMDPAAVRRASGIILPGVGAFAEAMRTLLETRLDEAIYHGVRQGVPILGICLGLQLLFDSSTESQDGSTPCRGLGLIPGHVTRLPEGVRVPHMGWNDVDLVRPSFVWDGLAQREKMYFAHSYVANPSRAEDVVATTEYGLKFPSVVGTGTIVGLQFHPEKSGGAGLKVLKNFAAACERKASSRLRS